jgi:Rps23 Pro-64 3,4-dihydroxylase Tpa1-like proline 4-hydroxylase
MVPGFNVLNLFKVPTDHSVSVVAPFAAEPRLALTGWFRQLDGATPAT